jgi:cell division protein FtsW
MARRNLKVTYTSFFTPEKSLILTTLVLSLLGLLFVFEASVAESFATFQDQYHLVKLQATHWFIGWVALMVGAFIPMKFWQKVAPLLYLVGIILLIMVFIPGIGREINGAYRWIFLPGFRLQPIEFVKLAITMFFASWMAKHQRLSPFLALTILPVGLVMLQPDLGSTLALLSITFGLYFVAGGQIKQFLGVGALGILLILMLIFSSSYRRERVETFLNPEKDPLGSSFHIRQITLALGRGGLFGQGLGNSTQRYSYIPEASTDSIFAIIAEELGFAGSIAILLLFSGYIWSGYQIVVKSEQGTFSQLVGMGILIWVSAQIILNISAVVALVPLTGVPLPFFSYGGSSLVMLLFASGILLSIAKK